MPPYFAFYHTDPKMPCQVDGETNSNSPNVQLGDDEDRRFTQISNQVLDLERKTIQKATQNFTNNYTI